MLLGAWCVFWRSSFPHDFCLQIGPQPISRIVNRFKNHLLVTLHSVHKLSLSSVVVSRAILPTKSPWLGSGPIRGNQTLTGPSGRNFWAWQVCLLPCVRADSHTSMCPSLSNCLCPLNTGSLLCVHCISIKLLKKEKLSLDPNHLSLLYLKFTILFSFLF